MTKYLIKDDVGRIVFRNASSPAEAAHDHVNAHPTIRRVAVFSPDDDWMESIATFVTYITVRSYESV